jgi:hypothetical protein
MLITNILKTLIKLAIYFYNSFRQDLETEANNQTNRKVQHGSQR